jgi:energy-coupling factor transporter ATP-binding protein EcfA2
MLNAGTHNRSNDLIERITQSLPTYVQTARFDDAERVLAENGVCLIAGEPGIGKTTLAQMLLLACVHQGFEALQVSEDVSEAWNVLGDRPQVFYYDDFLGRIGPTGLRKHEDQRLVDLIRRARRDPQRTQLILTTREYILRDAVRLYETFEREEIDQDRFLLALDNYSRYERGLVLYNHLYHSEAMRPEWRQQIVESGAYERIIDHPNYNPRLIQFITGHVKSRQLEHVNEDWVSFALAALDHPEEIWRRAFERDLDELQRAVLICLISLGGPVEVSTLEDVVRCHCEAVGIRFDDLGFRRALETLDLTFVQLYSDGVDPVIDAANRSVDDFVMNLLGEDASQLRAVLDGAGSFTQPIQLWEVSKSASPAGKKLATALAGEGQRLADALIRTFDSEPLGNVSDKVSLEERARYVLFATGDEILREEDLLGRFRELLKSLVRRWEAGEIDGTDAGWLYIALRDVVPELLEEVQAPLKDVLMSDPASGFDYANLYGLMHVEPSLFSVKEEEGIKRKFEAFARGALADEGLGAAELESIEDVAEDLEVDIYGPPLGAARERAYRPAEDDREESDPVRVSRWAGYGLKPSGEDEDDSEALSELFERLPEDTED